MSRVINNTILEILWVIAIISLSSGAMISLLVIMDYNACQDHAEMTDHLTMYNFPGGCYIDVDGKLVPAQNWVVTKDK